MESAYSPFDPAVRDNPYPFYAALRRDAPVQEVRGGGLWAVARYDDVLSILRDHQSFSSAPMNFQTERATLIGSEGDSVFGADTPTIIGTDPPIHTRLRNLVNRGFTPRRMATLEPHIHAIADSLLNALPLNGEFDLMADFAIPLPVIVIAELLGVEASRREDFKRWSDSVVRLISGTPTEEQRAQARVPMQEFRDYFLAIIEERRTDPRDDLISALIRAQVNEQALTAAEVITFAALLLVAGNETTTNLIGNAVLALLSHPEQLELVRRHHELVPGLIEEALRYDAPVQGLFRLTTRDVQLGDTTIPMGAMVMPLFASANRDECVFADPNRFDVRRNPDGHVAFGFGIHFCLGAALARLEARIGMQVLLHKCRPWHGAAQTIERIDSIFLRGPKRLQLTLQ